LFFLSSKGEMCGYDLRKGITEMSRKHHAPSFGSIYPALKDMKRSHLINSKKIGKKIVYSINEKGKLVLRKSMRANYRRFITNVSSFEGMFRGENFSLIFKLGYLLETRKGKQKHRAMIKELIKRIEEDTDEKSKK